MRYKPRMELCKLGIACQTPRPRWFCNPSHFDGATKTYAAKFDRSGDFMVYPMAWDMANKNIPGVNRTAFYNTVCGQC